MFCIRWCGVGDLFPEAVRVSNTIVRAHPDVRQWAVTRRPEMAVQINRDAPNLWLMFSLDGSAESKRRMAEVARHQHPRLYFSFLRVRAREETFGANLIFDHKMKMPTPIGEGYVCPGDAGRFKDEKGARDKEERMHALQVALRSLAAWSPSPNRTCDRYGFSGARVCWLDGDVFRWEGGKPK